VTGLILVNCRVLGTKFKIQLQLDQNIVDFSCMFCTYHILLSFSDMI